jgi:hypothetical protein
MKAGLTCLMNVLTMGFLRESIFVSPYSQYERFNLLNS